jgi:thiol-disulfide isomerase/thioredoxin
MQFRIVLFSILVGVTLVSTPLFAGGSSEGESSEVSVPESPAAQPEGLTAEERDEIKGILDEIGVQTFRGEIDAVDFTLSGLNGESIALSDLSGEFVFLNFWATWCPPCREEMPSMEVLHNELQGEPFRMVAVNVREDAPTVEGFIDEFGYTYPILLDSDGRVSTNYGVRGIPTTFFIAPNGTVLGMLVGTRYWDDTDTLNGMKRIAEIVGN